MPHLPWRDPDPVLDLRTRRTEAEEMAGWTRWAYRAGVWGVVLASTVGIVLAVAGLWVPLHLPFGLDDDVPGRIDRVDDPTLDLAPGDRILAIDGVGVEPTVGSLTAAAWRAGRGPYLLTVSDTLGGNVREVRVDATGTQAPADVLRNVLFILPALVMGLLGWLALNARVRDPAVRRFVVLCLAGSLPLLLLDVWIGWVGVLHPLLRAAAGSPVVVAFPLLAWPVLFGSALLLFLLDFLDCSEEERSTLGPPPPPARLGAWLLVAAAASGVVVFLAATDRYHVGEILSPVGAVGMLFLVILGPAALGWLGEASPRVVALIRLARERMRADPEVAGRLQPAVAGIRIGYLAFEGLLWWLIVVFVSEPVANLLSRAPSVGDVLPDTLPEPLGAALGALAVLLLFVALAAPFVGVGVAVLRRGLWDVDLLASRTAVASLLGLAFVACWAVAGEVLEAFVPGRFALAAPLVAGVAVAAVRVPVSRAVERRFFPEASGFPEAVRRASHRLGDASVREEPAQAVARAIHEEIGARSVAVLQLGPATARGATAGGPAPLSEDEMRAVGTAVANGLVRVLRDDGPHLAIPLGAPHPHAAVLVGARGSGRFYRPDERERLELMLAPLAHLIRESPTPTP